MSLKGKSIISIDDLSNLEIEEILQVAAEFDEQMTENVIDPSLKGQKLFTLFYEASSRTYFSFREAMRKLGGDWDGVLGAESVTSVAKGESIADTIRTIELVSDVIVIRHPLDGSARVAQEYSSKPIINGGDGAREHPTQTLVDLYTILKEKGPIKGQVIGLCGDLLNSRTIHSLAYALARMGAKIRTIALPSLAFPPHVRGKLQSMNADLQEYSAPSEVFKESGSLLLQSGVPNSPGKSNPIGIQTRYETTNEFFQELTALYMTRLQTERFDNQLGSSQLEIETITSKLLSIAPQETIIMHPLPRRQEIAYEVDDDHRAAYFRQMKNSIPVRMAILSLILGAKESKSTSGSTEIRVFVDPTNTEPCSNSRCVLNHETYLNQQVFHRKGQSADIRCLYCDQEIRFKIPNTNNPLSPSQEKTPMKEGTN